MIEFVVELWCVTVMNFIRWQQQYFIHYLGVNLFSFPRQILFDLLEHQR